MNRIVNSDRRLPVTIKADGLTMESALLMLADALKDIAASMPMIGDLECSMTVDPVTNKGSLYIRATR